MSPLAIHADNRRIAARVVLFMVVGVILTLVLFAGGPNGAVVFAQQTTSPGPTIKLINPDAGTSTEVTGTNDGTDEAYHLVAWVSEIPPSPTVEFKYQSGSDPEVPIGTASLVGADTYHLFWPLTQMPEDGTYTLRVRLFSGSTVVSEDSEEIFVNNEPPPTLPTSPEEADSPNAVEIVYPTNGGTVGFYRAPGASTYKAQIDVTASEDTTNVRAFYSVARPGSEPAWKSCSGSSGESRSSALADGVTCTLAESDQPQNVTGIAATANDTTAPTVPNVDSGDGHRATGYIQTTETVTVTPASQSKSPAEGQTAMPCSDPITATVTDQVGRRVAGANVDVHAQGPTDLLFFDESDADDDNSSHQAPDEGHSGNESAVDCQSSTQPPPTAGTQGNHPQSGADIKHIESVTGTSGLGQFIFQLHSRDAGATQFTVWVDEDDNDRQCPNEPFGVGSIGWGTPAPAPVGVPADEATCPSPTSTTTSPAPTSTTTSPSPTNTTSSPSPTETSEPPPPPPPPPIAYSSQVTLKIKGKAFVGQVRSDHRRCRNGRMIVLKKPKPGKDKVVGKAKTNFRAKYKIKQPNPKGKYYVVVRAKGFTDNAGRNVTCGRDRSRTKKA